MISLFNKFKNIHIKTKLILICLSFFLPILIVIVVITNNMSNNYASSVTIENNELNLKTTVDKIDGVIGDMERVTLLTLSDDRIQNFLANYKEYNDYDRLKNMKQINNFFLSILPIRGTIYSIRIINNSSIIYKYNSVGNNFICNFDYKKAAWVKNCQENSGGTVILGTAINDDIEFNSNINLSDTMAVSVARQINKTLTNDAIGYIKVDASLKFIEEEINETKDKNSDIVICDTHGNIIYCKNYDKINKNINMFFKNSNITDKPFREIINGNNCIVTSCYSTYTKWTTYCITPESSINRGINNVIIVEWIIILVGALIAVIFTVILSSAITSNIVSLNKSMKQVKAGNFSISLLPKSNDEIGELTKTFNEMVKCINSLIEEQYIVKIHNQKLLINQKQTELQTLLSQVNPHFLYNILDVIRVNVLLNNDRRTADAIYSLARFYRFNLTNFKVKGTLKDELNIVDSYIDICKFSYRKLEVIRNCNIEHCENYVVPRFILQPIIENAIKHGLETEEDKCVINIDINHDLKNLVLSISDNGIGMEIDKIKSINDNLKNHVESIVRNKKSGIGLLNVNKRIFLICGKNYGLTIVPNKIHGVTVICRLPIEKSINNTEELE